MSTFKERFNVAIHNRGLKPSQIAQKTGIDRGSISCYKAGRYEPKGDKLFLIAKVLKVSPEWLAGQDVPMDQLSEDDQPRPFVAYGPDEKRLGIRGDLINVTVKGKNNAPDEMILTESERKLIELLRRVPADQKGTAMEIVNGTLTALQKK